MTLGCASKTENTSKESQVYLEEKPASKEPRKIFFTFPERPHTCN